MPRRYLLLLLLLPGLLATVLASADEIRPALLDIMALARHLGRRLSVNPPVGSWRFAPYAIGGLAAFWSIQRVMSFLPVGVALPA